MPVGIFGVALPALVLHSVKQQPLFPTDGEVATVCGGVKGDPAAGQQAVCASVPHAGCSKYVTSCRKTVPTLLLALWLHAWSKRT